MELVEDFETDAVTCLACFGVRDLKCVGRFLELREIGFGDHLVGDCVYV